LAKAAKRAGKEASDGVVELYSHGGGRVGVMVEVNCETDFVARSEAFRTLAHEIALQIAAATPEWVKVEDVPQTVSDEEREIATNRAREDGKPEAAWPKIVEGRMGKFLDEKVLLRQPYVRDETKTVQDLISEAIGSIGENIVVRRFARWELGEHVEE
jgi:elongation factor Ts